MAEPPVEAAASGPDALLATKLYAPGPQPGFVRRVRLERVLDEGLARRLILVCAPAGYGKTALLADWVRSGSRLAAWLSLDAADNDPARFWRHVIAALDQIRPGVGERVSPLLGPPTPPSSDGLVTALINELAADPGGDEILLILDDYHLIDAQPVGASLMFLLEHLPPGLRLVLAGRSDPSLPLARLRAGVQLAEVRVGDLRFTSEEAASLLREAAGRDLPGSVVTALATRTEGWAAGLQLAALALRKEEDLARFVAEFSGSHRYVLDYLAEEVLDRQSPLVRAFLLKTSVLEQLSGSLCDAVVGQAGSQAMLEAIERTGLFLMPLDEVRGWWCYHHLFAELLRARLQREQPGQAAALHRNAAAWYDEHGLANDAVRHALAAGDAVWAAQVLERHIDALFFRGEQATVQRWLGELPAGLPGARPRLLLAQARLALLSGQVGGIGELLDSAERVQVATAGAADEPFEPSAGRGASLLANVPATIALDRAFLAELRGDAEQAVAYASRARAEAGDGEWMLASHADGYLGLAELLRGRLGEAERMLSATVARWRAASENALAARGCYHLGQVQRAQGRLDAAAGTYQLALEITAPPGRSAPPAAGSAYVGLAEVGYQRGELADALRHVTEGIARCRQLPYRQPLATGLATLAWIRQANGDPAGAREAMSEATRAGPDGAVTGLLNPVPAQRARLLLAQGDTAAAADWVQRQGLDAADDPEYAREPGYLVLARVLLAQDQPGRSLMLLERLYAAAAAQGRAGSVIEIRTLQALALAASGQETSAVGALADALSLACPQGYVRVFADEGAPMGALLGRLIAAQRAGQAAARVPLGCLARALRALNPTDAAPGLRRGATAAIPGLVEPLTARELEVLRLLAAGLPNQAIAAELVVALDTAKKHVSHVLGKLGAANRTEAVSRARQLSLIP